MIYRMRTAAAIAAAVASVMSALPALSKPPSPKPHSPPTFNLKQVDQPYIDSLKPISSGPGILIGDPVPTGVSASTADFAAACSFWLQVEVGGQGQFGQTPTLSEIAKNRDVAHLHGLRLGLRDIPVIARGLGVTNVVSCTIVETAGQLRLSYQLCACTGHAIGAPIVASGTEDQIKSQLPHIGKTIDRLLHEGDDEIPTTVEESSSEMTAIGKGVDVYHSRPTPNQIASWRHIAPSSLLAGLILEQTHNSSATVDHDLLVQGPNNTFIVGNLAFLRPSAPSEISLALDRLLVVYPNNYDLASGLAERFVSNFDDPGERTARESAVRVAPNNAWAWMKLGDVISTEAESIRRSRIYGDMSPQEAQSVGKLYPHWEACDIRSVELSPDNPYAWASLAGSATFNGDVADADLAFWRSVQLDSKQFQTYWWGLQMYQSKWGGSPNQLIRAANAAISDPDLIPSLAACIYQALDADNIHTTASQGIELQIIAFEASKVAKLSGNSAILEYWKAARAHPKSPSAWDNLSELAAQFAKNARRGRYWSQIAVSEQSAASFGYLLAYSTARQAANLQPNSSNAWLQYAIYGTELGGAGSGGNADIALWKAVRISPESFDVYDWALQMYQPKWSLDQDDLIRYAQNAEDDPILSEPLSPDIIVALTASGRTDPQTKLLLAHAQDALTRLIASNTQDPKVLESISDLYYSENDRANMEKTYLTWIKVDPNNDKAESWYGGLLQTEGRRDEAIVQYRKTMKLFPDDADTMFWLGGLLADTSHNNAEAEAIERKTISLAPYSSGAYFELGLILNQEGKHNQALAAWKTASELDPMNVDHGGDAQKFYEAEK